ncbi:MAG: energy-coupling factor transporter transmembrane component T family protein [Paracoccus sp. (in: a-proteobacteria)]|uniref:energy-coupling factor transporter transmembrane component T family protein n=1 Tax=Paracoccus sp. TaxID=267 RepID=UPI002E877D31|nr:energy-coupling factor transporter transmembrane protein EcfT [Pseudomonadota bacterium]
MISLVSPVRTRAHRWPAGGKLLAVCIATTLLFPVQDIVVQLAAAAVVALLYALPGRVFLRAGLRSLRPLLPFVVILLLWHAVTRDVGDGVRIVLRMVTLVALANLVTMTTTLAEMMDVLHRVLGPLRRVGMRTDRIEIGVALVVRFTPVLVARASALSLAWRARSLRRPGWRLMVPLVLSAFDEADHVADALRARSLLE